MSAALQQATDPMPRWVADHVSSVAAAALLAELETWPKPGLVSHVDSGSHADMDASMLKASATAIAVAAADVLATALFVQLYEEPTLRGKFGADYEEYCRNVRRWVPRLRAWEQ